MVGAAYFLGEVISLSGGDRGEEEGENRDKAGEKRWAVHGRGVLNFC